MSRLIYYNDCYPFGKDDILILDIDLEETGDLKEYIQSEDEVPKKVYELISMDNDMKIIILYYIKYMENMNEVQVDIDSKLNDFFQIFSSLTNSLKELNIAEYQKQKKYLTDIYSVEIQKFNRIALLFDLYENFLEKIAYPIVQETPYLYQELSDIKSKHWIKYDLLNKVGIDSFLKILKQYQEVPYYDSGQLQLIFQKIESLKIQFDKYNDISTTTEEKIFFISVYFFSLAKYYFQKEDFNISLVFIHRAIDTYFQHYAKSISPSPIIILNNGKLEYSSNCSGPCEHDNALKNPDNFLRKVIS